MKKLFVLSALVALGLAVPAQADKPMTHPAPYKCPAQKKGLNATGSLRSGSLQTGSKAGTYDGTLTVDVKRANHKAAIGIQMFTLSGARVHFGKGVTFTTLVPGDRVIVHGKITALPRHCGTAGFTPAIT